MAGERETFSVGLLHVIDKIYSIPTMLCLFVILKLL
jgi:hypothetical protein